MINILYIHGYNSNKNSRTLTCLKKLLDDKTYNVIGYTYDYDYPDKVLSDIKNQIISNNINIVIGSSLGGFITLKLRNIFKIVINPCCFPSYELPKLGVPKNIADEYKRLEKSLWNNIDNEEREITFGIFGDHDELFSYKKIYESKYNNVIDINDGHRISENNIKNVLVPLIKDITDLYLYRFIIKMNGTFNESYIPSNLKTSYYDVQHITLYNRNSLNEKYINALDKNTMKQYADEVWNILQMSYAYCGGLLGLKNVDQLIDESDMWKMVRRNGKINCVLIYSFKRGGRKTCYGGTDGTIEGKIDFFKIINDDINIKDRHVWAEVSGKTEHIYIKNGAVPIPSIIAKQILFDKEFISFDPDGYHYTRYIGGIATTKMMVGNFLNDDKI